MNNQSSRPFDQKLHSNRRNSLTHKEIKAKIVQKPPLLTMRIRVKPIHTQNAKLLIFARIYNYYIRFF